MNPKFKYLLFPENLYTVTLEQGANPLTIEISGKEIIEILNSQIVLDMPSEYEV